MAALAEEIKDTSSYNIDRVWKLPVPPPPILRQEGVEVTLTRLPNLVDAYLPIDLLRIGELPVDELQMTILEQDFDLQVALGHENGQRDAIGAALLKGDNEGFDIHDGYHRSNLLHRRGAERVYASITINCDLDELIRLRTLAATPHEMVKPPRLVLVGRKHWELTPWAEKGIKITQAFQPIVNSHNTSGIKRFESAEDANNAAAELRAFCKQWGVRPLDAYGYFLTADVADPNIFFSIQGRRSGDRLNALTYDHVFTIARREYKKRSFAKRFEEQNIIKQIVLDNALNVTNTRILMSIVAGTENPDQVRAIIEEGAWKNELKLTRAPRKRNGETPAAQIAGATLRAQTAETQRDGLITQLSEAQATIQALQNKRSATPDARLSEALQDNTSLSRRIQMLGVSNTGLTIDNKQLQARVTYLEGLVGEVDRLPQRVKGLEKDLAEARLEINSLKAKAPDTPKPTPTTESTEEVQNLREELERSRQALQRRATELTQQPEYIRLKDEVARLHAQLQDNDHTISDEVVKSIFQHLHELTDLMVVLHSRNPAYNEATLSSKPKKPNFNDVSRSLTRVNAKREQAKLVPISNDALKALVSSFEDVRPRLKEILDKELASAGLESKAEILEEALMASISAIKRADLKHRGMLTLEYWALKIAKRRAENDLVRSGNLGGNQDSEYDHYLDDIKRCLPHLPTDLAKIVVLRDWHAQSDNQIGVLLSMKPEVVAIKRAEARKLLTQQLPKI